MSLIEKLKKNSTIKESDVLSNSTFFQPKDLIQTQIPMLNVALSGSLKGGYSSGLHLWCGNSKHFKTGFCLILAKAYLDKYEDGVILFYDSEFGSPQSYFESFGIDLNRVIHTPITDIEQFKHDVINQVINIDKKDHVLIVVDSIGNLASRKEVNDAIEGSEKADMTRAKQLKSFGRMITPHLTIRDIPMHCVNHIYSTMELYSKAVVSGGQGIYLSADAIYIIGRQQEKGSDKELTGYNFVINVEKSRHVIEKSKINLEVRFDNGISPWSGLLEVAMKGGFVLKPKIGWYCTKYEPEVNYREKDTNTKEFWLPILTSKEFNDYVENTYKLCTGTMEQNLDMESIQSEYLKAIEDTLED